MLGGDETKSQKGEVYEAFTRGGNVESEHPPTIQPITFQRPALSCLTHALKSTIARYKSDPTCTWLATQPSYLSPPLAPTRANSPHTTHTVHRRPSLLVIITAKRARTCEARRRGRCRALRRCSDPRNGTGGCALAAALTGRRPASCRKLGGRLARRTPRTRSANPPFGVPGTYGAVVGRRQRRARGLAALQRPRQV